MVGREGKEGASWHDGVPCRLLLLALGTRSAVACCGCCGWSACLSPVCCLLSGVPCHSGGLWLAGSRLVFPTLQPPLFVPVECGWMGLDWLVGFGWVVSRFCFSGPLVLSSSGIPPPTGLQPYFSDNSSLMILDDRPLILSPDSSTSCNYSTTRVWAVAFNAATTSSQNRMPDKPGCLAVNCP